jgi:hypothetical protein
MLAEMGLHGAVESLPWIGGYYRVSDGQLSGRLWRENSAEFRTASDLILTLSAKAGIPVVDFWIDHLCIAPDDERSVYLRLLQTAVPEEQFTVIRRACERRLKTRLPLTRLERLRVPRLLADLVRDLDRAVAGRHR